MRYLPFSFLLFIISFTTPDDLPRVTTNSGTIEGLITEDGQVEKYLGIPYAKPPVGDLRWKAPQPLEPWEGVKECKEFGNIAIHFKFADWVEFDESKMSEDCLYLNVWKPASYNGEKLPVLFNIHGGGFWAGQGSEPRINGESMAKEGVIVVTINYRLHIFGFLAHPELSAESESGTSGNYGLMDQQMALKWVYDNIEAFGGDPNRITIAGESAGSESVLYLMTSPLSRHMVAGAIGSSGGDQNIMNLKPAENGHKLACNMSGFKTLEALRNASVEELIGICQKKFTPPFQPIIDGQVITAHARDSYKNGDFADIPIILGWNNWELPPEAFLWTNELTKKNFKSAVTRTYKSNRKDVLEMFPHSNYEEIKQSSADLAGINFVVMGTYKWFDAHRNYSTQPVYRYQFNKAHPPKKGTDLSNYTPAPGARHAEDIPYSWGNLQMMTDYNYNSDDYKVAETMKAYYVNFIKTGDPNGDDLREWPICQKNDLTPSMMVFDTKTELTKASKDYRLEIMSKW
ncbi:MAG: carboxylesterase/lipase family protein [Bacteroidia bacterium]